jgi:hypothetical protein
VKKYLKVLPKNADDSQKQAIALLVIPYMVPAVPAVPAWIFKNKASTIFKN